VLHTGAYWLLLKLRDAIPRPQPLATAEFTTLRMRLTDHATPFPSFFRSLLVPGSLHREPLIDNETQEGGNDGHPENRSGQDCDDRCRYAE
jgi:hypothetical protein